MNADNVTSQLNRRAALQQMAIGAGTMALGTLSTVSKAATSGGLDLATAEGRLRAFMRMRGALDDRLVIGYLSGRYYGVVDSEITLLYGLAAATFSRYRPLVGGGYQVVNFEQAYFTDPETGVMLENFRNPYTGQMVKVPVTSSVPSKINIAPDMSFVSANPRAGFSAEHIVLPVEKIDDDVIFVEQTKALAALPPPAKPFRYNEIVTLSASANDLNNPDSKRVACQTTFSAVVAWRPWLEMGDRPGHLLAQGSGRYGASINALPKAWLDATKRVRPELLSDPGKVMDALWNAR